MKKKGHKWKLEENFIRVIKRKKKKPWQANSKSQQLPQGAKKKEKGKEATLFFLIKLA